MLSMKPFLGPDAEAVGVLEERAECGVPGGEWKEHRCQRPMTLTSGGPPWGSRLTLLCPYFPSIKWGQ